MNRKIILLILLILFWPAGLIYFFVKRKEINKGKEKNWLLNHPFITWIIFLFVISILISILGETTTPPPTKGQIEYDLELSIDKLDDMFGSSSKLTDVQKESKFKELEGKRIKTTIRADEVSKASLSSQYVVLELSSIVSCKAKAFFPSNEKEELLKANEGDMITLVGEFVAYKGLFSCIEFSNSKVIDIKSPEGGIQKSPRRAFEETSEILEKASQAQKGILDDSACAKLKEACENQGAGCSEYLTYC